MRGGDVLEKSALKVRGKVGSFLWPESMSWSWLQARIGLQGGKVISGRMATCNGICQPGLADNGMRHPRRYSGSQARQALLLEHVQC